MEPGIEMDDDALVAGFLRGEYPALDALYRRFAPNVFDYLRSLVGRHAGSRAEDLLHDVFLRAIRYRHTFRPAEPLLPWLLTIARNEAQRSQLRRPERAAGEGELEGAVSREPSPLGHLVADERLRLVEEAWSALPEISREILHLRYREGLSLAEVAQVLGVPRGTLAERTRKAMERLRSLMGDPEVNDARP